KNDQKFIDWISLAEGGRILMAISAGDEVPSIWESGDDGRSWHLLKALPSEIAGMSAEYVSTTEWIVYQEDGSAVWSTVDGGATWRTTKGTDTSIRLDKVSFASPDRGWAVEICSDSRPTDANCDGTSKETAFFETTDGGRTWTRIGQPTVDPSPTPTAVASSDGSAWTSAGSMLGGATGGRGPGLSAFTLRDGRVLVVAGQGAPGSAELYDPASGSWSSTMPLIHSHDSVPSAALLRDGRVLILGGVSSVGGQEKTAEIFDPETGRWEDAGKIPAWLSSSTMVVLPDGRVLVLGGWRPPDGTGSAGVYDPSNRRWTVAATPARYGGRFTATLLANGLVLVAGGSDDEGHPLASAQLYDPATDTWAATGALTTPRVDHTATSLTDGRVLVGGGARTFAGKGLPSAEIYDPSTGTWTATGSMGEVRGGFTATSLSDGRVLVAGGNAELPSAQAVFETAELYDPNTGAWTATAGMAAQRAGHVATLLGNGTVLVAGGYEPGSDDWLATAERYRPGTTASP
ncbi:MAG TPA: kelch repeat-containing protein, partial [Candidatus Saccharimonadia bacterium]|nr:kelch repeat-containing protein [Candidatus Saccharimonadia bacterium]